MFGFGKARIPKGMEEARISSATIKPPLQRLLSEHGEKPVSSSSKPKPDSMFGTGAGHSGRRTELASGGWFEETVITLPGASKTYYYSVDLVCKDAKAILAGNWR